MNKLVFIIMNTVMTVAIVKYLISHHIPSYEIAYVKYVNV